MDKLIENEVIITRRKKLFLTIFIIAVVLSLAILLLRRSLTSSVNRSNIITSVVERGTVDNTISATGIVQPEFEEIVTSPIHASIQKVLLDAGSKVVAGQSVIALDKSATELEYARLKFQLESKRNDIRKLKLNLDKSFFDMQSNNSIKQLRINSLEASVENAKRLFKAGGGTREDIEQAELDLQVARLEKKQLENEITSKQKTMKVEIRESEIAAAIQQNDLNELERKLRLANIVASRNGVVTWINRNIGASVAEGESIARIADLGSFKVTGSIPDSYIQELHNGLPAIIRINDTLLRGTIVNIYPTVQNGIVTFDVQMNERSNKLFRPNMKVDVFLVTAVHNGVMRVANGAAFKGAETQDVFVVTNNTAKRRTVHTGMSNFDFIEIKDNLNVGDVIITSDMDQYKNSREITIK